MSMSKRGTQIQFPRFKFLTPPPSVTSWRSVSSYKSRILQYKPTRDRLSTVKGGKGAAAFTSLREGN
ncbi:hypothetical protein Q5P01_018977 [Channa striata]|uniref:Uncharacterized protein n=1 Tax=Channa striata TaxID=64152 RepID=A0AA88M359_CHASR|nr:hypothetical protein Q5P01_018977 [Channa striata]